LCLFNVFFRSWNANGIWSSDDEIDSNKDEIDRKVQTKICDEIFIPENDETLNTAKKSMAKGFSARKNWFEEELYTNEYPKGSIEKSEHIHVSRLWDISLEQERNDERGLQNIPNEYQYS